MFRVLVGWSESGPIPSCPLTMNTTTAISVTIDEERRSLVDLATLLAAPFPILVRTLKRKQDVECNEEYDDGQSYGINNHLKDFPFACRLAKIVIFSK